MWFNNPTNEYIVDEIMRSSQFKKVKQCMYNGCLCTLVPLRAIHVSEEDVAVIRPVDPLGGVVNSKGRGAVDFLVYYHSLALTIHASTTHMWVLTAVDPKDIPK